MNLFVSIFCQFYVKQAMCRNLHISFNHLFVVLVLDGSKLAADWNVLLSARLWEAADLDALAEEQAVRGTTEVEHTSLLSLLDVLALLDGDLASGNFVHTDTNECHETNGWVVGLDEDDGTSSQGGQVTLTSGDTVCVNLFCVWVTETLEERLTEVCAVLDVGLLDGTADGCVPAVVRQGRQESLVDSATSKLLGQRVVSEHVRDAVWLTLDPELVAKLGVLLNLEDLAFTSVVDDAVVIWAVDRPYFILEVSGEEVVPRGVTVVLLAWVTDEKVLELVIGLVWGVGDGHHVTLSSLSEPTGLALVKNTGRCWLEQELAPFVENLLEHLVDIWVEEGSVTGRSGHWVVENGTHWHTDHTDCLSRVGPDWSRTEDVVQNLEHVVVVTDLLPAGWVLGVDVLVRNLFEHGGEVHVDSCIALDELLELL